MVIYAQVVYIHLGDRVWVCVHNYGLHEERIHAEQGCIILAGDFTSWVKPSSIIVESQKEFGFNKS